MNCQEWEDQIMQYFDQQNKQPHESLMKHIKDCNRCSKTFRQFEQILNSLEPTIDPPKDFEKAVMAKIQAYSSQKSVESNKFFMIGCSILAVLCAPLILMAFSPISIFQAILKIIGTIINFFNLLSLISLSLEPFNLHPLGVNFWIKIGVGITTVFGCLTFFSNIKRTPSFYGINHNTQGGQ